MHKRSIGQVVTFLIFLAFVIGGRYYYFIEFEDSPYGEVGKGLQTIMPAPVKAWGCKRLRERFPNQTGPGCE